jgi:phosphatidylinositol glycan class B
MSRNARTAGGATEGIGRPVSADTRRSPGGTYSQPTSLLTPGEVRGYLIASLVAVVVTSFFSVTFFHPDEQFQVLEFVGLKLGRTSSADLPWEFHDRMRPWLQPAAYYVLARGAKWFGVDDPFAQAFVFRLASGILAWVALARLVRTSLRWCDARTAALVQIRAMTLVGMFAYLAVRTSSENVSCSLVTIGFCSVLDALPGHATAPSPAGPAPLSSISRRVAFSVGGLFGLAFECRYQTAILAAGLVAWLCFFRRIRTPGGLALAAGMTASLALGLLVDRWGYGVWSFPPARYFYRNVVDHVAARRFGVDPIYGYLYLLPANLFAPVVVVLMATIALTWIRHPKHPVTWTTLPYALVHCVLGHKEERFFFPMLLLTTASVTLGLSPQRRASALPAWLAGVARFGDHVARRLWSARASGWARLVVADNVFGLLLLAVYPLGWRPHLTFYEYVDHRVDPAAHFWKVGDWEFPEYPFFRRGAWRVESLPSLTDLPVATANAGALPADYFVSPLPYDVPTGMACWTPSLVYSEFPGWTYAPVRAAVGPILRRARGTLDRIPLVPKADWLTLYRLDRAADRTCSSDGTTKSALSRQAISPLMATHPND